VTLGSLIGHERARGVLARAVAQDSGRAGYLFTGPVGVGRHLAASGFVRALLCTAEGARPCGDCPPCRRPAGAPHPDLLEVVPQDNRKSISVEQIRALGAWLVQSPALGRRKAAIVDPADAMTEAAANALLKALEEPPRGRVVVLIAERAGALPPTVRSRCQQVAFGPLTDDQVAEVLRRHGWPFQASQQAAALAEGSPGLALQLDGRSWQEAGDAVRALFDALAAGERGAAFAFAESAGEARERALQALQSIAGFSRLAARRRLGDRGVDPAAVPRLLLQMSGEDLDRLLASTLETHRRLGGDRPPNAKLALATLLAGAAPAGDRQ
jgi:DNA polymerase-3 subunit delta'